MLTMRAMNAALVTSQSSKNEVERLDVTRTGTHSSARSSSRRCDASSAAWSVVGIGYPCRNWIRSGSVMRRGSRGRAVRALPLGHRRRGPQPRRIRGTSFGGALPLSREGDSAARRSSQALPHDDLPDWSYAPTCLVASSVPDLRRQGRGSSSSGLLTAARPQNASPGPSEAEPVSPRRGLSRVRRCVDYRVARRRRRLQRFRGTTCRIAVTRSRTTRRVSCDHARLLSLLGAARVRRGVRRRREFQARSQLRGPSGTRLM